MVNSKILPDDDFTVIHWEKEYIGVIWLGFNLDTFAYREVFSIYQRAYKENPLMLCSGHSKPSIGRKIS